MRTAILAAIVAVTGFSSAALAEGKKIGWKDGISAIRCILRYTLLK